MWNICTDILLINSLGLSEWSWGLEMGSSMEQKGIYWLGPGADIIE
jgi:hypothetical protein